MKYLPGWNPLRELLRIGVNTIRSQAVEIHRPAFEIRESSGPRNVNKMVITAVPDTQTKIIFAIWGSVILPERDGKPADSYSFPYFMIKSQKWGTCQIKKKAAIAITSGSEREPPADNQPIRGGMLPITDPGTTAQVVIRFRYV